MNLYHKSGISFVLATCLFGLSCEWTEPVGPRPEEVLDGPIDRISHAEGVQFLAGDQAFSEVFTMQKGLGPIFVTNSCISCHAGDGKGTPFTTLTRFGQSDGSGNHFLHRGGPQLQTRAIPGFQPEALPDEATSAKFTPPAVTGLGFLQHVTDQDILAMADPEDADGDGISGVPNWMELKDFVTPAKEAEVRNGRYIHRFGKKAAAYDLLDQTVNAYNQDMGITSTFDPRDGYTGLSTDPEVSDQTIRNLVIYLNLLKAPIPRNQDDAEVIQGKKLFAAIGCASCHRPELKTGPSPIEALAHKTFYPYTDLLLHDMGPQLDDGYTEGNALTSEWRTPPLWGLGLSPTTQGETYFLMHDGRAGSIQEAILIHGGEAEKSKNKYQNLTSVEKIQLIKFLESL